MDDEPISVGLDEGVSGLAYVNFVDGEAYDLVAVNWEPRINQVVTIQDIKYRITAQFWGSRKLEKVQ